MFLVSFSFSFLASKEFILQNALLTLQSACHHQVQRVQRWSGRRNSDLTLFVLVLMCQTIENIWTTWGRRQNNPGTLSVTFLMRCSVFYNIIIIKDNFFKSQKWSRCRCINTQLMYWLYFLSKWPRFTEECLFEKKQGWSEPKPPLKWQQKAATHYKILKKIRKVLQKCEHFLL